MAILSKDEQDVARNAITCLAGYLRLLKKKKILTEGEYLIAIKYINDLKPILYEVTP